MNQLSNFEKFQLEQQPAININALIGVHIRASRRARGMSMKQLGDALKVSSQQIFKYEKGYSTISVTKLLKILSIFEIPAERFFIELDLAPPKIIYSKRIVPEELKFLTGLRAITNISQRKSILNLVCSLGK